MKERGNGASLSSYTELGATCKEIFWPPYGARLFELCLHSLSGEPRRVLE